MNVSQFYNKLGGLSEYDWKIEGRNIISVAEDNRVFNPVTAIALLSNVGTFLNNKKSTLKAATALGLPRAFAAQVYDASRGTSNRGNVQVVRGRIRSALGV